jgi:hypothetical protein
MPAEESEKPQTPEQGERDRKAANLFLLAAGAILVAIGVWLVNAMVDARRADDCIAAGRRNCSPIEIQR